MNKKKFIVDDAQGASDDRAFRNGKVVFNKRLGFAYSVDEIVEVLNNDHYYDRVMDLIQNRIWYAQGMYKKTKEDRFKFTELLLKELREELYEPECYSKMYADVLKQWFLKSRKED